MNTSALSALVRKDLKLYFSNRRALIVTLAAPIAIAAFFGSMFGSGDRKPSAVPIAVVDQDGSAVSKQILAGLNSDTAFKVQVMEAGAALEEVKRGKLRAAVVLPPQFGKDAGRALFGPSAKPEITVHYDPSQSMVMPMVRGLLTQHVMKAVTQSMFSANSPLFTDLRSQVATSKDIGEAGKRDLLDMFESIERVQKRDAANAADTAKAGVIAAPGRGFDMPFSTKAAEVTSSRETRYNSYTHSFAGMTVQFLMFMGIDIGIGLLLARRMGLWKRLRAAPLTRATLLGSTVISTSLIAIILMTGIFAAGMLFFGVRIEGSVVGFAAVIIAFALLTSSFGLLLAAIGNNPEVTRGIAIFATLILVMLGGAWVPSFVFPEWLQSLSLAIPTRWAIDGFAAMTWRGLGIEAAVAPVVVLLAFCAVMFAVALWRFQWSE
jgi:ABC-2 type transport system permease protein